MTEKKKTRQSKGMTAGKKAGKTAPKKKPVKKKASAKAVLKKKARKSSKETPSLHWLVRPETIRKLWIGGGVLLAALVVIELGVPAHGSFGLDGTFAFNAWFGFAACVAMILFAKGLGIFLKRKDTYYDGD